MSADYRKIVQSLSYLAGKSGGGLNRLHAFKMLFLADRDHLRRCGCLITGDSYVAMKYGPLPVAAERLVKEKRAPAAEREYADAYLRQEPVGRSRTMLYSRDFDATQLSEQDIVSLDVAWNAYASHPDVVDFTHEFPEWKRAAKKLTSGTASVPMRLLDFFLPAPAAVEYCAADPEWVEASRELFCDSAWVEGI